MRNEATLRKQTAALFMTLTLASSVCGCGQKQEAAPPPPTTAAVQQKSQQIQNNPNLPPQVKAMQMQGIGEQNQGQFHGKPSTHP